MSTNVATSKPTRIVDGVELPVAGTWVIDPDHTQVGFTGRHLVFTKVRGRFGKVEGAIHVAADPNETTVEAQIDMTSVESGSQARDEHLRSPDLFDVARFPTARFSGRARNWKGANGQLTGDLTIKGITRPVVLSAEYLGSVADPWGEGRVVLSASTTINREDWDVSWNMPLETGGLLVSREVTIEIEIEAIEPPHVAGATVSAN